jgi:hypothetical protein
MCDALLLEENERLDPAPQRDEEPERETKMTRHHSGMKNPSGRPRCITAPAESSN